MQHEKPIIRNGDRTVSVDYILQATSGRRISDPSIQRRGMIRVAYSRRPNELGHQPDECKLLLRNSIVQSTSKRHHQSALPHVCYSRPITIRNTVVNLVPMKTSTTCDPVRQLSTFVPSSRLFVPVHRKTTTRTIWPSIASSVFATRRLTAFESCISLSLLKALFRATTCLPRKTSEKHRVVFRRRYLEGNKVNTGEGSRKVECTHHFRKCADAVCQKLLILICVCRSYILPKLARF